MDLICPVPVDAVTMTTIIDDAADLLAPNAGKARDATLDRPCTSKAQIAMARRMPEAFAPNAVGATFELKSLEASLPLGGRVTLWRQRDRLAPRPHDHRGRPITLTAPPRSVP